MIHLSLAERVVCASEFLKNNLTSRERMLVAAYAYGFSPTQVAHALDVSPASVTQMASRIAAKATRFWEHK